MGPWSQAYPLSLWQMLGDNPAHPCAISWGSWTRKPMGGSHREFVLQIQFPHDLQVFLVVIISGTKGGFYFQKEPIPQRCPFWQSSSSP